MVQDLIRRFEELTNYHPKKGIINEGYGHVDTNGWICIGEVPYYPWYDETGKDKTYIMVSPEKIMKWGEMQYEVVYTENNDGTGKQTDSLPSFYRQYVKIYPEHYDDEYGEKKKKKKQDESVIQEKHKDFVSNLFKMGNKIIIHHNSSYKITEGLVKKGTPNGWSNNTDIGIYFWGSRSAGKDPSNNSTYTYYCIIDENDLYDFETNAERLTLKQAMGKYKYAGQYWKKTDRIVVTTFVETPIWCILDKLKGKWYDKDWNEIEKPF